MKDSATTTWIERMYIKKNSDMEKILNQIHRDEYNFHKPKKSLCLNSEAVKEIINGNLYEWVVPLPPEVLEDAYYYAHYMEKHQPTEDELISDLWFYPGIFAFKDGEIININAKEKDPYYVMVTNLLITKLDRCNISSKGYSHEKGVLEGNYGKGFCERNPIVILYLIDRVPYGIKTHRDYIYFYNWLKQEFLDFCAERGVSSDNDEALKEFVKKKRL